MEALKASLGMAKEAERKGAVAAEAETEAAPRRRRRAAQEEVMRAVTAARYVVPLREGGSLPGVIEGDDGALWVTKSAAPGRACPRWSPR